MHPLLIKLQADYPGLNFQVGSADRWSPQIKQIDYRQPISPPHLLHEVGHALLRHTGYSLDIELLKIEADAWAKAQELASGYKLTIDQGLVNDCLETYKLWILDRSQCPDCQLVGVQDSKRQYTCPNCQLRWSVPPEIGCTLGRKRARTQSPRNPYQS